MKASIIIPVWKGAAVIERCLEALFGDFRRDVPVEHLYEVICVDNASDDDSANRIAHSFPQARLIRQPVNLGFSGGINVGVDAAQGDVFILLNQDCIVQPGWISALIQALDDHPQYGLIGCQILNEDGSINHTGATLSRPDLYGRHLTDLPQDAVRPVDYATGAALAIRRQAWQAVGCFDEGFYPAYFEDVDYAYRARRKGIETGCAMQPVVQHLFSSREWQNAPLRHAVILHSSRYRFACKHLEAAVGGQRSAVSDGEKVLCEFAQCNFAQCNFAQFVAADLAHLQGLDHLNHAIGRMIAARTTIYSLQAILAQRKQDLAEEISPGQRMQISDGLAQILKAAYQRAKALSPELPLSLESFTAGGWLAQNRQAGLQLRKEYNTREHEILQQIFFRPADDLTPESAIQRIARRLLKRLPSRLSGRDNRLWSELSQTQRDHIELLSLQLSLLEMLTDGE